MHGNLTRSALLLALLFGTSVRGDESAPAEDTWWAFEALRPYDVPNDPADAWSRTPVDRFVWRHLSERELTPASEADKRTLIRRLYFDLIGVPPTPGEIDAFINDASPDAWEKQIDALLADPRYGEHWARYWLDIVRYAESDGWNKDSYRPNAWRYRDYVVDALNDDKPYPKFVLDQLAGDEQPDDDPARLAATGFLRLGVYEYNQRDARAHWNDILNEITDATGDVFLGVGTACARCHDHKFDAIPQVDYFKLRAFFEPLAWRDDLEFATPAERVAHQEQLEKWNPATRAIRAEIDALLKPYFDKKEFDTIDKFPLDIQACVRKPPKERTTWENQMTYLVARQYTEEGDDALKPITDEDKQRHEELKKQLATFDAIKPKPLPKLMAVTDAPGEISRTLIPGAPDGASVAPGFLTALAESATPFKNASFSQPARTSGRRTALATWIGRSDNPLTMRVIVNRIWRQHFGVGIVATPNDFGRLGQLPTHPELLDWLTEYFVANGARFKPLHRLILTSATWRQSATHPDAARQQTIDASNEWLWRARIRRLSAEQLRDAMLSASGEFDATIGGPSVDSKTPRRGLYVKRLRNSPDPLLHSFDAANGLCSVADRNRTTTPIQSLLLLNGDACRNRAAKFAARVDDRPEASNEEKLQWAFETAWGRRANDDELTRAIQFVSGHSEGGDAALDHDKLVDFCQVLFNSNAFLYVD